MRKLKDTKKSIAVIAGMALVLLVAGTAVAFFAVWCERENEQKRQWNAAGLHKDDQKQPGERAGRYCAVCGCGFLLRKRKPVLQGTAVEEDAEHL